MPGMTQERMDELAGQSEASMRPRLNAGDDTSYSGGMTPGARLQ